MGLSIVYRIRARRDHPLCSSGPAGRPGACRLLLYPLRALSRGQPGDIQSVDPPTPNDFHPPE